MITCTKLCSWRTNKVHGDEFRIWWTNCL